LGLGTLKTESTGPVDRDARHSREALAAIWPLFGMRLVTPRLELALLLDDDLVELVEVAVAGEATIEGPGLCRELLGAGRPGPQLVTTWALSSGHPHGGVVPSVGAPG
jgi:hypothetical protein